MLTCVVSVIRPTLHQRAKIDNVGVRNRLHKMPCVILFVQDFQSRYAVLQQKCQDSEVAMRANAYGELK